MQRRRFLSVLGAVVGAPLAPMLYEMLYEDFEPGCIHGPLEFLPAGQRIIPISFRYQPVGTERELADLITQAITEQLRRQSRFGVRT